MNFVLRRTLLSPIVVACLSGGCSLFWETPAAPLHAAAARGDVAAIRELVGGGADVNARDDLGATALYWAARGGHRLGPHQCGTEDPGRAAVIAALLDLGADPNVQDRRPKGWGRSSGWTPLFVALHHAQFASARMLLEHGADPNILSDQGMSAMGMASAEGAPRDVISLLVAKGFDPQLAHRRD